MASLIGNNFICESKTFVQHNDIIFFKMKDEIKIEGLLNFGENIKK